MTYLKHIAIFIYASCHSSLSECMKCCCCRRDQPAPQEAELSELELESQITDAIQKAQEAKVFIQEKVADLKDYYESVQKSVSDISGSTQSIPKKIESLALIKNKMRQDLESKDISLAHNELKAFNAQDAIGKIKDKSDKVKLEFESAKSIYENIKRELREECRIYMHKSRVAIKEALQRLEEELEEKTKLLH